MLYPDTSIMISYDFNRINNILYGHLRPFILLINSPDKFRELISAFHPVSLSYKAYYEVQDMKALTPATAYYKALIDADINECYNRTVRYWLNTTDPDEKFYITETLLNRTLKPLLRGINYTITEYYPQEYNRFTGRNVPRTLDETGFVMQYLKLNMIALFLNLQARFEGFLKEGHLTQEDLLMLFFSEEETGPGSIGVKPEQHQPIEAVIAPKNNIVLMIPNWVNPAGNDEMRMLLVKEDKFNEVVNRLKEFEILDENGKFIKNRKKNNSRFFAVVCEKIINSDIFRRNIPGKNVKLKQHEYLRMLGQHFSYPQLTETFKKLTPAIREEALIGLPWLDNLFRKY